MRRIVVVVSMSLATSLLISTSGCSSAASSKPLSAGLVTAAELGVGWKPFKTSESARSTDLCGQPLGVSPTPVETAKVAWAIDPDDGPIFGQRIERFRTAAEAARILDRSKALRYPCNFVDSNGAQWRAELVNPPSIGHGGRLVLVRSLDRQDSYNYEFAVVSGTVWFGCVLNVRNADDAGVKRMLSIAWSRALKAGIVHE